MKLSLKNRAGAPKVPETPIDRLVRKQYEQAEITVSRLNRTLGSRYVPEKTEDQKLIVVKPPSKK